MRYLADYRLRHLVNNVAMHMITLEWGQLYCIEIFTASIVDLMVAKIGLLVPLSRCQ